MSIHVFGIRHHGPGCARSLVAALAALEPDLVLIEGPPDAEEILPLASAEGMTPPVALLVYQPDSPRDAVFYPFAVFSPEWQALRVAQERRLPVRFMDLPQAHQMALKPRLELPPGGEEEPTPSERVTTATTQEPPPASPPDAPGSDPTLEDDPLGMLALAAGYGDRELWWEHQIEQRRDPTGLFEAIMEAMTELRARAQPPRPLDARREAFMRQTIRAAQKEDFARIAVVCGAWHAPVLAAPGDGQDDQALLKGLPRTKVVATWIPWSYGRLAYRSGYGAGVVSTGWYHHLWTHRERAATHWAIRAARLLRSEVLDASSASVIETVRLAETLAAVRELPMAGLGELNEAVQSVLCFGETSPMALIGERLEIGDRLGRVPADAPAVPLQRDLEARQRRLRLKPSTEIRTLDLDLRQETDRARSRLLHQLGLLGIPWGQPQEVAGKSGTFHEIWRLQWQVEFAVAVVEASVWGNAVDQAASASARNQADKASDLPRLTALLDQAIRADLPQAVAHILACVQAQAAVAADVRHLMDALLPLARVARYGDVRGTRTDQVLPVLEGLYERILVGLAGACASLDDDAAGRMVVSIDHVQQSLHLLDNPQQRAGWQEILRLLLDTDSIHGLVRGWCCRLLLDQRAIAPPELHRRARLALSPAVPALQAAAWIEGLLRGSGLVVLQEDALWQVLDDWLRELTPDTFLELLPLLRRAFAGFQPPERRAMGEKVRTLGKQPRPGHEGDPPRSERGLNRQRADLVLPVLAQILGIEEASS